MAKSLGERAGKAVQDNHPEITNFVGITGLSALDIFSLGNIWLFVGFAIVSFGSIGLSWRRNRTFQADNEQIEALKLVITEGHRNFYDVWDGKAREIYQELGMDMRQRLSFYKYDDELKQFRLLGRFSDNANYRQRKRHLYPTDQGVIGMAWKNGECYERALPNPTSSPERYEEDNLRKYNIPLETCRSFTMPSTCLWALALRDDKKIPFAVVVVESTKRDDIDRVKLRARFDESHHKEILGMTRHLSFMEPSIRAALKMGL